MSRVIAILALLLCAAHAQARTLYVSLTGSHDTNAPAFSTWAAAATNIQAAIDAAVAGDKIILAHGTYVSTNTPAVGYLQTSGVTIQGMRGTLFDADKTIIDARGISGQKPIAVSNAANAVVRGLTLTGGNGSDENSIYGIGGGLYVTLSPVFIVENCIVRGNAIANNYNYVGSGIYLSSSAGSTVRGCVVVGNKGADNVAAMGGYKPTYSIENSIIEANTSAQIYGRVFGISVVNSIHGNVGGTIADTRGNLTSNTTNSVCRLLDIAPASEGVGTNLVWRGVSAYIPRLGSLARKNGPPYAGIETASDGAGGPALVTSRPFLGRDATTNLNHGIPVGGVTASTNSPFMGGGSAAFDGTSGSVDIGKSINASLINSSAITVEAFAFNRNTASTRGILMVQADTGAGAFIAQLNGTIQVAARSQQSDTAQWANLGINPTNAWVHYAAVIDYQNSRIIGYANGAAVVTQSVSFSRATYGGAVPSTVSSVIGANKIAGNQWWQGEISEARIWSVARTPEEIAANYTNRLTGTEAGLVGYWPLKDPAIRLIDTGPFNLDNPIIHPTYMEAF